ncbi:VC0807 family protein [Caulobacter sp. KR2-114]|uniref:VC0807 family protein n=1 Tax=Caulobacter sp. KR2-114 TaxID=3400912 RepID=UPI003C11795E
MIGPVSAPQSRAAMIAAWFRTHGLKLAFELLVNFIGPYLIYSLAAPHLGDVKALLASSVPPLAWSIIEFARERKVDAISVLALTGIVLSLIAFVGGGGVKMLQLRETLVGGLVGLVFLGSAAIGRPLIHELARARMNRRSKEAAAAFEGLTADAAFRRAMTLATVVWGAGLVGACAINCALVFALPIKTYLLVGGPVSYGAIGLLTAWTFWFVPRARRSARARQT